MRRLLVLLVAGPLFAAGTLPNRYIVELSTEPVAAHVLHSSPRGKAVALLHTADADRHRAAVRAEQATARVAVEAAGARVLGTVENLMNALLVTIPDARASQLSSIPGVRAVYPDYAVEMTLDHALPLLHIPDAWSQMGVANAGAGIKIGMIDTGIDIGHPGFNDAGFTAPAGFPRADTTADLAFTNNKVIVARSYTALLLATDPDNSARDELGHGTATAMTAAGVSNTGPLAVITGAAPGAYLGAYKVFGTPGFNDSATTSAIIAAIDDAVSDGMDILNLSLGSNIAWTLAGDVEVQVLDQAVALGVIVVASAGNNGPDPFTVGTPADAPSVIAVGASNNDRTFSPTASIAGGSAYAVTVGQGMGGAPPVTAALADVAPLDGTGQACGALPPNSLAGSIAFIVRGNCSFESKLDNAQAAGAIGALLYDNVNETPLIMIVGQATLPAEMLTNTDGLAIQQQVSSGLTMTLTFTLQNFYTNPNQLASFSAQGPNVDYSIKPDVVAVGENIYTAAQTYNPGGSIYDPSGYAVVDGTSFSGPLVAGSAAILKQARPGLTVDQYRSMLVNTAGPASLVPGTTANVQQAGAGLVNALSAINATAAVAPVSLGFGAGGDFSSVANLTITNVGAAGDQFQLAVVPSNPSGPVPSLAQTSVQLDPGASIAIPVTFVGSGLVPGQYEGFVTVQGTQSSVVSRVPYWYGVPSGSPAHITVLPNSSSSTVPVGATLQVLFRVTDSTGLPVSGLPTASSVSGGGSVLGVVPYCSGQSCPFALNVRTGTSPGTNVFQILAGSITLQVSIVAQ